MTRRRPAVSWILGFLVGLITLGCQNGTSPASDRQTTVTWAVQFDGQGGSPIEASRQVDAGAVLRVPVSPTKVGSVFMGWYSGDGYSRLWDFAVDRVTGNLTLHAAWVPLPQASTNLLINADFTFGSLKWQPIAASGCTLGVWVTGGIVRLDTTVQPSNNYWDVTFLYRGMPPVTLVQGKTYGLSFLAWSDQAGAMVRLEGSEDGRDLDKDGNLWTVNFFTTQTLTTTPTKYSTSFIAAKPTDDQVSFKVETGFSNSTIYLDDIVLKEE